MKRYEHATSTPHEVSLNATPLMVGVLILSHLQADEQFSLEGGLEYGLTTKDGGVHLQVLGFRSELTVATITLEPPLRGGSDYRVSMRYPGVGARSILQIDEGLDFVKNLIGEMGWQFASFCWTSLEEQL